MPQFEMQGLDDSTSEQPYGAKSILLNNIASLYGVCTLNNKEPTFGLDRELRSDFCAHIERSHSG